MYRRREPLEKNAVLRIELHYLYFTALLTAEKALSIQSGSAGSVSAAIVDTMSAPLKAFAELCEQLSATSRKLEKRALIGDYLKSLSAEDASRAALYLSGQPFAETDSRNLNVGGSLLSKAVAQLSGADRNAMYAAYRRNGDLGAAAFDLFQVRQNIASSRTLEGVEYAFADLANAKGPTGKLPLLLELLEKTTPLETKYLIKLITGDMRIGVKQSLVEEAIAHAWNTQPAEVRRAVMLTGSLPEVTSMAISGTLQQAHMRLFHALGFMLASPVATVDEALERFSQEIAAEHAGISEALPEEERIPSSPEKTSAQQAVREAQLEDKYDGIRAQLHCGESRQPGRVALFSRNREDIGESFPELMEAFEQINEPAILDGEIVAWNPFDQRALPFTSLQQRLGRRRVSREMRERTPVVFVAFDLLYLGEELMLEYPLSKRRSALEQFVGRHAEGTINCAQRGQAHLFAENSSNTFAHLILAPAVQLCSAEQLDRSYTEARERGNEGVMLKALHSIYQPGRRGLAWLKLKRELATLDVVVTGAEYGHGRRAGVLSDYTFAVKDGDELKNIGKAYSGLTDAEIDELTEFFKQHTLEDYGGFRTVEPLVVLEVAFNNIMHSDRHNSGFALRFPRILRIRTDKPVSEIDTLERAEDIYNAQPDKPTDS
ncbi:ATP-dependent DNA ligase [Alloacidobacterium sp.]|uniref:ATP-dependent DNA ligase n=1 Tax=Alloacidobacterium sp. TaxID=2951999 RepID=UPI002D412EA5|nr:ATP-dependent DNA ligase [Alloacidobacterium sp.]HYK38309.1 ATP-dependent DNA ligase [Alloacidobacterium sp.]